MFRRKGSALTKTDVVQAALYCLEQEGESSLGINRVARELNIKPPSIYNHISSNEELRISVAVEGWKKLYDTLSSKNLPKMEKEESIKVLLDTLRHFAHENKNLYLVVSSTTIEQTRPDFLEISTQFFELFNHILSKFEISQELQIHVIRWLRSMAHGFILLELKKQFELPTNIEESYAFIITTAISFLKQY